MVERFLSSSLPKKLSVSVVLRRVSISCDINQNTRISFELTSLHDPILVTRFLQIHTSTSLPKPQILYIATKDSGVRNPGLCMSNHMILVSNISLLRVNSMYCMSSAQSIFSRTSFIFRTSSVDKGSKDLSFHVQSTFQFGGSMVPNSNACTRAPNFERECNGRKE